MCGIDKQGQNNAAHHTLDDFSDTRHVKFRLLGLTGTAPVVLRTQPMVSEWHVQARFTSFSGIILKPFENGRIWPQSDTDAKTGSWWGSQKQR